MITLNYGTLRSDLFRNAFSKMGNSPVSQPAALRVLGISKKLEEKLIESQDEWIALMRGKVKAENGIFKLTEDKSDFDWLEGVDLEEARKEVVDFARKTVEIDAEKLTLDDLAEVKLSAAELSLLEPVIDG